MKIIDIYTDGSHLNKQSVGGRLGCGGIMVERTEQGFGKVIDSFSEELTADYLEKNYGTSNVSNPTAEMLGLFYALSTFNIPKDATQIVIHSDYNGVGAFMTGTWKIKEPYIKKIKERIDKIIKAKRLDGKISYEWVKAHQSRIAISTNRDAYWNNYVDSLAKGEKK